MRTGLRARAAAAMVLALVVGAGCSDARPNARPNSARSSPSQTTTPSSSTQTLDPQAAVKADVLAAYRGFSAAVSRAERHPNRSPSALKRYAIDKALANARATVALYRQQGIVVRGRPRHDPEVIALSGSSGTATIRDCVDLTGVEAIYRETGESALAPNQSRRHVATAKATVLDGRWVIREVAADRKTPC